MHGAPLGRNGASSTKLKSKILVFLEELKECGRCGDLDRGRRIHAEIVHSGDDSNLYVANALIHMYSKCGSLPEARRAFDRMDHRSAVSWNSLILGYAKNGGSGMNGGSGGTRSRNLDEAKSGGSGGARSKNLDEAKNDGSGGTKSKSLDEVKNGRTRSKNLDEARMIFERMPWHSVFSWTDLIHGYAENGREENALGLFSSMASRGCEPDARTFQAAFKALAGLAAKAKESHRFLERAIALHTQAASSSSCEWDVLLANSVMDLYGKCGGQDHSRMVFERMPQHDVVSWNAVMLGYCDNGEEEVALEFFETMRARGCVADARTYVAAIKACVASLGKLDREKAFERGMEIHCRAGASGCDSNVYVAASLVNLYAKCGKMVDARRVFDKIFQPDVVSWSALILGYAENGQPELALELFARMQQRQGAGSSDALAFVAALKACARLAISEEAHGDLKLKSMALEQGMAVHAQAARNGCELDVFVASTLVDMYTKCGSLLDARRVFDRVAVHNAVFWNSLMLGYCENEQAGVVLLLFHFMQLEGCALDAGSFVPPLKALASLASIERSLEIKPNLLVLRRSTASLHSQASERGFDSNPRVASSLVDCYSKSGSLIEARRVFDRIEQRDPVLWTSLIVACADAVDAAALSAAIKACASGPAALLETGKRVHGDACRHGLEVDPGVVVSLVDFYGKCGSMVDARCAFDASSQLGLVAWNALLAGYGRRGDSKLVLEMFHRATDEGLRPNASSLVSVLAALSGGGLVDQGRRIFQAMECRYGVRPGMEHYACLVDIFSRADKMDEAVELARRMSSGDPRNFSVGVAWTSILAACRKWENFEVAKVAFEELRDEARHPAVYNLMANACST
ncbi:pentatricopeptide repeat-containing protein At3g09040, mitochondrial-like [Selaginella moellendorffii]|uniref:pentatricopeptide repeat-containing protein At3g09040, mitochondrial-like n=1 Tax=Selaginella moellendorffii TaxID=88036 RepID=UPI000D1C2534|nr:pentatricopeptide repeat-containing protein At3g09040, mitochondrial-like [Selaginella moellendorffii]|eukprot:XP_024529066.1 pentatricopeptide repeat-containing protein At3g09040, mitochondrial-like [Selaginella moellendorffii]